MYPKGQGKEQRIAFWTAFGRHMERHRSLRGPKQSWLNYKTGIKHVFFRLHAEPGLMAVSIDIQHSDPSLREVYFDQFWELETLIHTLSGAVWDWQRTVLLDTGQEISRIQVVSHGHNLYDPNDWQGMFAFFAQHILALDEVWVNAIDLFKDLER